MTCVHGNGACSSLFACAVTGRCLYAPPDAVDPDEPAPPPPGSLVRKAAVHDFAEINRIMNRRPPKGE